MQLLIKPGVETLKCCRMNPQNPANLGALSSYVKVFNLVPLDVIEATELLIYPHTGCMGWGLGVAEVRDQDLGF